MRIGECVNSHSATLEMLRATALTRGLSARYRSPPVLVDLLVTGLLAGSLYALVALGLVVIFKTTDVVNFAQGELVTAGAYFGLLFYVTLKMPWIVVVPAVLVASCVLGLIVERLVHRPLAGSGTFTVIVATIAIGVILRNVARFIWTDDVQAFPAMVPVSAVATMGGVVLTTQSVLVLGSSAALVVALYAFFETKRGKAMLAVQHNRIGAQLVGIRLPMVYAQVWAMSAVLAGAAGFLLAPLVGVSPAMGWIALKGFVAAVIGGFSSIPGAIVGGFVVGIVENLAGAYISTAGKDIVTYAILVAMLMVRPSGLLGRPESHRA